MVAPALAGEDPYVAIVGNDWFDASHFYFSEKHQQFLYNEDFLFGNTALRTCYPSSVTGAPATVPQCETFKPKGALNQAEVCDIYGYKAYSCDPPLGPGFCTRGLPNAHTPAGNSGTYEWWIRLPKKPSGEINIVIQCGVFKPNAFDVYGFQSAKVCAAETGERVGYGVCARQEVDPGTNPVNELALPKITAIAYPGPFNPGFTPFHLTAFKNPSSYTLTFCANPGVPAAGGAVSAVGDSCNGLQNSDTAQVLDGSTSARVLLKACMDKVLVLKLPVSGQVNACSNANIPTVVPPLPTCFGGGNETETDLWYGDLIYVRMDVPRQNTVDIYCHAQSVRLDGVGEAPF